MAYKATARSIEPTEVGNANTESLLISCKVFTRAVKRSHLHWEYAIRG